MFWLIGMRPIPGERGYLCAITGDIYSVRQRGGYGGGCSLPLNYAKARRLRAHPNPKGYLSVEVNGRTRTVHSLVALTYIGPRPDGMQVAHYDGDPANNHAKNLRYASAEENHADRLRHKTAGSKLTIEDAKAIYLSDRPNACLALDYDVSETHVRLIKEGKKWSRVTARLRPPSPPTQLELFT